MHPVRNIRISETRYQAVLQMPRTPAVWSQSPRPPNACWHIDHYVIVGRVDSVLPGREWPPNQYRGGGMVGQEVGLRQKTPTGHRVKGPRLHDLRHTMAVRTLINWLRSGVDPDHEMYKLSTWLGHSDPRETYWYLEAVPELLELTRERAERAHAQRGQS